MAAIELKVKGWPRGWKQWKTRTRLIVTGPKKTGLNYEFSLDSYRRLGVDLRQGATLEWFNNQAAADLESSVRHYQRLLLAMKVPMARRITLSSVVGELFGQVADITKGC